MRNNQTKRRDVSSPVAKPTLPRCVEVWSFGTPPFMSAAASRSLPLRVFHRKVVARMWHAPTKTGRVKYDPDRRVKLLGEDNRVKGVGRIEDAIVGDRAVIIDLRRPDLVCIDVDNVPKPVVRRFVRQHLHGKSPYVLLPSGGRSVRLPSSRERLHRYHLFVVAERPETARALGEVTRKTSRAIRRRAEDEEWPPAAEEEVGFKVRRAIRGPLFAHRLSARTGRLRRYSRMYPEVLSAILDVFDTPCSWTRTELAAAEQARSGATVLPPVADSATRLSTARQQDLLAILDDHSTRHDLENWGDTVGLVNRLDLRGFTAEQVWEQRDHPSLRLVIQGRYRRTVSEVAAWKTLSRLFEDAAQTRPPRNGDRIPLLREDVIRAAVLCLKHAQLKTMIAAALMERKYPMKAPRSKRTFERSVTIGQAALAGWAGIASSATVNKAMKELREAGWIVKGPIRPWGQPEPFALVIPRWARSKLKQCISRDSSVLGTDRLLVGETSGCSKLKHNSRLPQKSMEYTGEGAGRGRDNLSLRETLGALLEKRAVRVRGLPASALQIILADLLGIARCDLPLSRTTMTRAEEKLREIGVLDHEDRLTSDFLTVLQVYAVEGHHADAADRQAERERARSVGFQAKLIIGSSTPGARKAALRALLERNPSLGDLVRQHLRAAYGSEWHKTSAS